MKHLIKPILIAVILSPTILFAQKKGMPITISLFNEATAIPFTKFITTPIHPGIQAGTEFNYRVKKRVRLFQSINLSYFFHNHLAQGIKISTELGYEYRLKIGLAFSGRVGLGYLHSFATKQEFSFDNGTYKAKADRGNARIAPSLSIDAGYYFRKAISNSPEIFIRYETWAEYPYSPGFIPVMLHTNFHIGARIYPLSHSK